MAKMYLNNRQTSNTHHGLGRVNFNMKSEDLDQLWFHKEATRDVSLALLSNKPQGTFLIRPSSQIGSYAMSWVKNDYGEIGHNLIYGLCPGYSLKQNPTNPTDRFWSLQTLVEGCTYLVSPIKASSSTASIAKSSNSKTNSEVVGRIIERVSNNDFTLSELIWSLYIIGDNESNNNYEKRTYVKYCDEEYTAPEILPLSGNSLTLIAQSLHNNTHTHSLFINGYEGYLRMVFQSNIGDAECSAIANMLIHNKSITLLNLSVNDITDIGAKLIASALKENKTLKILSLSHNFIGKEGLMALSEAIRSNRTLDFIDVSSQMVRRTRNINLVHSDIERTLVALLEDTLKRKCELFGISYDLNSNSNNSNNNFDYHQSNNFSPTSSSSSIPMSIGSSSPQNNSNNNNNNINFSLSLQKLPYFHGFLTKQSAEKRLRSVGNSPGSFLFYLNHYIPNSIFLALVVNHNNRLEIIHKMIHRVHFGYRFVNGNLSNLEQEFRDEVAEEELLYNFQINNRNNENTITHTNSYNYSYRYRPKRKGCGVVIPTLFEFCSWILASHPQYKEIQEQLYSINSVIGERFQDIHDLVPLWGGRDVHPVVALSSSKHHISRKGVYPTLSQLYKLNKSKLTNPVTTDKYKAFKLESKNIDNNQG
eukprot:gene5189-6460_t